MQGGSGSPLPLKWQLLLAAMGGVLWRGFLAGMQMLDPFPGAGWVHQVLSRRRTASVTAGTFAWRIWVEIMFIGM